MDLEIFEVFKNNKLEVILIGLGAFLLTFLIKWPIKKQTAKLAEEKRKMVNIIIIFIPLILSAVASVVFYGITTREWISWIVVDCSISAWLISLSLYAVVSRIVILIRGLCSGKVKLNSDLTKDAIKYIKEKISELNKQLKTDGNEVQQITKKLNECLKLKDLLTNDSVYQDLAKISEINSTISSLQQQKNELSQSIVKNEQLVANYNSQLYV